MRVFVPQFAMGKVYWPQIERTYVCKGTFLHLGSVIGTTTHQQLVLLADREIACQLQALFSLSRDHLKFRATSRDPDSLMILDSST